jgi:hypothetical protein
MLEGGNVSDDDKERKRIARMNAAIERQRRKNQSRAAIDKRKAAEAKLRRNMNGDD